MKKTTRKTLALQIRHLAVPHGPPGFLNDVIPPKISFSKIAFVEVESIELFQGLWSSMAGQHEGGDCFSVAIEELASLTKLVAKSPQTAEEAFAVLCYKTILRKTGKKCSYVHFFAD